VPYRLPSAISAGNGDILSGSARRERYAHDMAQRPMGRERGLGRPSALRIVIRFHYVVRTTQGGTRPRYVGAQLQLKPGVQRGRCTFSDLGPLS
jgi:hypothetical protein